MASTNDFSYWNQLSPPHLIKASSTQIDYIDFSPRHTSIQHNFAVTSDLIKIYDLIASKRSSLPRETINNAYGGTFDKDGRFIVCGDEEGYVRLCEMSSEGDERQDTWTVHNLEKKHTDAVHRTFFTADRRQIASFSDDRTVRLWDLSTEKCLQTFDQVHTDNIRAGCTSPLWPNILLSAGYDGKAKMLDSRTNLVSFEVSHGFPIQSILFLPSNGIFVSCGGPHVKLWDAFAGGNLLTTLTDHLKDIRCLQLACNGSRLLSGGWDRKVNIYDTKTYSLVHSLDFKCEISSMAIAPDDGKLAAGMTNGHIVLRLMDSDRKIKIPQKLEMQRIFPSPEFPNYIQSLEPQLEEMLRKHEHSEALRAVFTPYCTKETPQVTFHLLHELLRRQCLAHALKRQSNEFLLEFISFLIKHFDNDRSNKHLIEISNILLHVHGGNLLNVSGRVNIKFMKLKKKLENMEKWQSDLVQLRGAIELLMSGAIAVDEHLDAFSTDECDR